MIKSHSIFKMLFFLFTSDEEFDILGKGIPKQLILFLSQFVTSLMSSRMCALEKED